MAALDLPVVARASTLHCSGGPLRAVSLNQLHLSLLNLYHPKTSCIRFRSTENIYFKPKNMSNGALTSSMLRFLENL